MDRRTRAILTLTMLLIGMAACQLADPGYGGTWVGTTTPQGREIMIVVQDDAVSSVAFDAQVVGPGWTAETEQTRPFVAPIRDGEFSAAVADEYTGWAVELTARFVRDELVGTLWVEHMHPQGLGAASAAVAYRAVRGR